MYKTPLGIRTLAGAERRLFVESLGMMVDYLDTPERLEGFAVFEDLQRNQQIAMLHKIARGLLCDDQPAERLTAVVEATVAAVYQHTRDQLWGELDGGPGPAAAEADADLVWGGEPAYSDLPSWRERVLAACRELRVGGKLPAAESKDRDAWDLLLSILEDCVLWDTDWAITPALDAAPDVSRRAREELGIDDDYFVDVAPDPRDAETARLLEELVELTAEARDYEGPSAE